MGALTDHAPRVTAAVVAATLLLLDDDPDLRCLATPDASPHIEEAVRETIPALGFMLDHVPWQILRRAALFAERLVSPGFVAHYALRKYAVREQITRAVREGMTQVVLLGAGFDMLAQGVPKSVKVFEVDHPGTQATRRKVHDEGQPIFVPVDLASDSLADALRASPSFDPAASTLFVAEGLIMYLRPDRVDALLQDVTSGAAARRIVVTVVTPDRTGEVRLHSQRWVVDRCMRWLEEPFVWGEDKATLRCTLERYGLHVESIVSTMELRDRVLPESARRRMPRITGEVVAVAGHS